MRDVTAVPRLPVEPDRLVGATVRLAAEQCRYRADALNLRVRRVRLDISGWYGGDWVWLEGDELGEHGQPVGPVQALVTVAALTPD